MKTQKKLLILHGVLIAASVAYMCIFPFQWSYVSTHYDFRYYTPYVLFFLPALCAGCFGLVAQALVIKRWLVVPARHKPLLRILSLLLLLLYVLFLIFYFCGVLTRIIPIPYITKALQLRLLVVSLSAVLFTAGSK